MRRLVSTAVLVWGILASGGAVAGERQVTLRVENLFCATCPYIVKQVLAGVSGVSQVDVSYQDKMAVVTFDDSQTDVSALTAATTNAGFPSRPEDSAAQ
jgi:mercuric ion binding protein